MPMEQIFIRILNMSLTAGIVILLVIFLRLFLKRLPKVFSCLLWTVVLFRLLCPISFTSAVSLLGILKMSSTQQGQI
ncbi:MAG: M56 family metallopeptidase, partial [Lachnospiraceae bacterium]|nr:M56 family metallopeptidase [Lachnospiraceae bacterium]